MTAQAFEQLCTDMSVLLCHPAGDHMDVLIKVMDSGVNKQAENHLRAYKTAISDLSTLELQELYTRTFDLNPMCSPALSVHLFGVESFKRSHLMVGLLDLYSAAEFPIAGELADHMSTIVRFLPIAPNEQRSEISQYILLPGLSKIAEFLETKSSPYANLIKATTKVIEVEVGKEAAYA